MEVTAKLLCESFPKLLTYHSGPDDRPIIGPSSASSRYPHSIVFLSRDEEIQSILESQIATLVLPPRLVSSFPSKISFCLVTCLNPRLAMAKVLEAYFPSPGTDKAFDGSTIHSTAVIHPSAEIGKRVIINPLAVVSKGCKISDDCVIGSHCVLEPNVTVGERCVLGSHVFLGARTVLGRNCRIHSHASVGTEGFGFATDEDNKHVRIPHHGRVVIEDDVRIGAGFCIDRGTLDDTVIGRGTKIDNWGHIAHNCKIGRDGLITAGAVMAGSVTIGDNFTCGGRLGVNGHVRIGDNIKLSGNSTVTGNLDKAGHFGGYPLLEAKKSLRVLSSLQHLPKMRKMVFALAKRMGVDSKEDLE